jgi:CMP-N-acetylneuraminic acid synthetase
MSSGDKMFLGITPARGGSKGIPYKNIKMIAGKPLLAWTIERALESELIDKYVVSTEDKDIKKIAKAYGAEVIDRPPELATDNSLVIDTLKDVVEKIKCKHVVVLQATSPVREEGLIDFCIQTYKDSDVDSVATGFDCKFMPYGTNTMRRQDYEGFFYDDGNVYVINANIIRNGLMFTERHEHIYTSKYQNLEIDDPEDFWLVEQILKKEKEKKEDEHKDRA